MSVGLKVRAFAAVLALSASGLLFIKSNESTENIPYLDSVGIPTVCTGHTGRVDMSRYYTDKECNELLAKDTHWAVVAVQRGVTVALYQSQFDALVDFCFQYGARACRTSTLFRLVNRGEDRLAAEQFARWKFAQGRDCSIRKNNCYGVAARNKDRRALFLSDLP